VARNPVGQRRDSRPLPQHCLFRGGSLWRRRRGAAVLWNESRIIEPCRVGNAGGSHSLADATGADAESGGCAPARGYGARSNGGGRLYRQSARGKRLVGSPPIDLGADTTLDPRLQEAAERVVETWLGQEGVRRHVGRAAIVALAPDGAVLALVGGRDYTQSQFNRAVQARRQAGSLFKIFVYLASFNAGYTPDSVVVDQPVTIGDWQAKKASSPTSSSATSEVARSSVRRPSPAPLNTAVSSTISTSQRRWCSTAPGGLRPTRRGGCSTLNKRHRRPAGVFGASSR
jgi:hypothetical protein